MGLLNFGGEPFPVFEFLLQFAETVTRRGYPFLVCLNFVNLPYSEDLNDL